MLQAATDPRELWDVPAFATSAIILTSLVYVRGFRLARRTRPRELPTWRLSMFLTAMVVLFLAIASPVDTYADVLLLAHMTQHLLLMSVVPPLIALGAPVVPMLRGTPRWLIRRAIAPLLRNQRLVAVVRFLRQPAFAWLAMNIAYLGWHVPAAYELALRSESWHNCEHTCFLLTSLLFWWNVLQPWPSKARISRWAVLPYLFSADLVNTGVSAYLCFAGRVLYPTYARERGVLGLTPLTDQVAAGAEMWVLGSLVFLIPLTGITFKLLSRPSAPQRVLRVNPLPPL